MKIRSALLALLTALLVIGGAVLPWAVSLGQDRYLESQEEVWVFDPVGLRLGDEPAVWPVLRLVAGDYEWLNWDGEMNLAEGDALGAALRSAAEMEEAGLLPPGASRAGTEDIWMERSLLVSGDVQSLSAVVWNISWSYEYGENEAGFCNLLLDDSTGKMVQFIGSILPFGEIEQVYACMENWRVFLSDYYGLEVEVLGEREFEVDAYGANASILGPAPERRFILGFDLGEELGRQKMLLDLLDRYGSFNT